MAIKDIFLPLLGEPDAAAIAAIDKCVAVSGDLGARVTAMAVEEDIPVRPTVVISNDLDNTAAAKVVRSVSDARGLLRAFDAATIRWAIAQAEERLISGRIPILAEPRREVQELLLDDSELAVIRKLAQEKTCEYQNKTGRDLFCSAATLNDKKGSGPRGS